MTDYNDGKWHGWNGGKCPVHPKSHVQVVMRIGTNACDVLFVSDIAGHIRWDFLGDSIIVAFRATNAFREPREFWINYDGFDVEVSGVEPKNPVGWIHVREVRE